MMDTKYRPLTPEERERYGLVDKAEAALEAQRQHAERQRLRDQFATAALTGLLARPEFDDDPRDYRYMCRAAYKWADAMMLERQAEPPEAK
jgi:alcohol dehydrogenase YqhD (iron-dependent ADH family)